MPEILGNKKFLIQQNSLSLKCNFVAILFNMIMKLQWNLFYKENVIYQNWELRSKILKVNWNLLYYIDTFQI